MNGPLLVGFLVGALVVFMYVVVQAVAYIRGVELGAVAHIALLAVVALGGVTLAVVGAAVHIADAILATRAEG